jgi:hypothetical protein
MEENSKGNEQDQSGVRCNDWLDDARIPLLGILGVVLTISRGEPRPPRWLCMNDEAKEKYIGKGKEFLKFFVQDELNAEKRRNENDPLAFFV